MVPGVWKHVTTRFTATVFNRGGWFLACDLSRCGEWFSTYWGRPPWPPRSKEAIPDLDMLYLMEGAIFLGCIINPKLLSDLDLGEPDDLRSDLRGQLRLLRSKIQFYTIFHICFDLQSYHWNWPKIRQNYLNPELFPKTSGSTENGVLFAIEVLLNYLLSALLSLLCNFAEPNQSRNGKQTKAETEI